MSGAPSLKQLYIDLDGKPGIFCQIRSLPRNYILHLSISQEKSSMHAV